MQKIVMNNPVNTININDIDPEKPVFGKKNGRLKGMAVFEKGHGWNLKTGPYLTAYGSYSSLEALIVNGIDDYGYEFFVDY